MGIEHYSIHTGQHYSYEMDRIFFEELDLPDASKKIIQHCQRSIEAPDH